MASQLVPPPTELKPDERRMLELYREGRVSPRRPSAWPLVVEALLALRSLVTLLVLAFVVLLAISLVSVSGGVDQRLSGAVQRSGQALTAARQAIGDVFNPIHPPRYPISQDTELSSLQTMSIGDSVGQSADFTFTLADIRRRDDASGNPDFAQYAILHRQYRVPHETKILGVIVHSDRGEQQYILDRGVSFRIGNQLYKVNWISAVERQVAVGAYRNPDQFTGQLAFDSD